MRADRDEDVDFPNSVDLTKELRKYAPLPIGLTVKVAPLESGAIVMARFKNRRTAVMAMREQDLPSAAFKAVHALFNKEKRGTCDE